MTHSREFHAPCKSGDNAELSVTHSTYADDDEAGVPDDYISFKTSRGKAVWLNMHTARELAGWLIEHAITPEPEPDPQVVTVPPGHGVAMFGGGGNGGVGGVAYGGAGGAAAYGGRGGAGGQATIVQRSV